MTEKIERFIGKIIMNRWSFCENIEQLKKQIDNETEVTLEKEEGSMYPVKITIERLSVPENVCKHCGK